MNDGSGLGTLKSIGIDMAHDIVTYLPFPKLRISIVDIILMSPELFDLLIGDIKPELLLRLSQRYPEPAPGAELMLLRKKILHVLSGIALRKGAYVFFVSVHIYLFAKKIRDRQPRPGARLPALINYI